MKPVLETEKENIKNLEQKLEDSTDLALFVRTSGDDIVGWNRKKIIDALYNSKALKILKHNGIIEYKIPNNHQVDIDTQ